MLHSWAKLYHRENEPVGHDFLSVRYLECVSNWNEHSEELRVEKMSLSLFPCLCPTKSCHHFLPSKT